MQEENKSEGKITDTNGKKPPTIREIPLSRRQSFAESMLESIGEGKIDDPKAAVKTNDD